jgi:hypothetical protein
MDRSRLSGAFIALLLVASSARATENTGVVDVTLAQLTSNSDEYEGKHVRVSGYLRLGFERSTLCPTARQAAGKDCVWISGASDGRRKFDGKSVAIHGIYVKGITGHMGCCSGAVRAAEPPALLPN